MLWQPSTVTVPEATCPSTQKLIAQRWSPAPSTVPLPMEPPCNEVVSQL